MVASIKKCKYMSISHSNTQKSTPRIDALDVLRGIGLLGIFLMNIEFFNRPIMEMGLGPPAGASQLDMVIAHWTEILITGKFWPLFSMIFGMGFEVMQHQAEKDGKNFIPIYIRRCFALLILGVLHSVFLWPGDILHSYAIVGMVLLFSPRVSSVTTIVMGVSISIAMALLSILTGLSLNSASPSSVQRLAEIIVDVKASAAHAAFVYTNGDYWQVTMQRISEFVDAMGAEYISWACAFSYFLIGSGIMRSGVLSNLKQHRGTFLKYAVIGLLLGGVMTAIAQKFHTYDVMSADGFITQGLMLSGNLPLAICYLCLLLIAMSYARIASWLKVFVPAGKMALSHYLLQSIISSTVFFGYGLGYWGQWGRANLVVFVFVVFTTQVIFSYIWLWYFRYGPIEWLLRAVTYMRLPEMKRLKCLDDA
jgi:uncharacterized protein